MGLSVEYSLELTESRSEREAGSPFVTVVATLIAEGALTWTRRGVQETQARLAADSLNAELL